MVLMDGRYILAIKPAGIDLWGGHDPSAAVFEDGELIFATEEERHNRNKHSRGFFPEKSIRACLEFVDKDLSEFERVLVAGDQRLRGKNLGYSLRNAVTGSKGFLHSLYWLNRTLVEHSRGRFTPLEPVKSRLESFDTPLPPIEAKSHHGCHAASAFHPSGFDEALVLTIDGVGEYDSTVIWRGDEEGLQRLRTFRYPNSLGTFYSLVTEYLGYRANNGEGKVMGLAPYGERNDEISGLLREKIDVGPDYDVTSLTRSPPGTMRDVRRLEDLFDRPRSQDMEFTQWEKDLAYETQLLLEDIVTDIVEQHLGDVESNYVCLSGGVALNCKLNKRIMEMDDVEGVFVQPVANDAGLSIGAGWLDQNPSDVDKMEKVYMGSSFDDRDVTDLLEKNKISYSEPDNLENYIAEKIADGELIGWFQGRMEMGPRALGNRSILADPRTEESRDRVNRYVKHREEWRPFAPSMKYEAGDEYLENFEEAPFMIKTFDVVEEKRDEIEAVIHPADDTTRPQTVRGSQNPRYHRLLSEFEDITGVPVLLNTSFNDHGEPIIRTPKEAIKDFFAMGLDVLAVEDVVIEKGSWKEP